MAKSDDELVVYHSADEFEWYENLDVDRERWWWRWHQCRSMEVMISMAVWPGRHLCATAVPGLAVPLIETPFWASGLGLWLALVATTHLSLTENTLVSWNMKTLPSDTNPTEVTMLRAGVAIKDIQEAYQSQVMPPVISPNGLSLMRSLYLYEKVREYIRDPRKREGYVQSLHQALLSTLPKHLEFQTVTNQVLLMPFLTHLLWKTMFPIIQTVQ